MKPNAAPMDAPKPAFGLPESTPEDDALALVARMVAVLAKMSGKDGEPATALASESMPDPRRYMPVAAVQALLAERATTLATMSEERAGGQVADALRRGHIFPAMKGWATALCRSDEAAVDAFLSSLPPAFAHLTQPTHTSGAPPASVAHAVQSETAAAICAQLGLPPGALNEGGNPARSSAGRMIATPVPGPGMRSGPLRLVLWRAPTGGRPRFPARAPRRQ